MGVLRKSYATYCEADGEDCPHDHVSSCDHVEHVLSRVFLDPNRVNTFEKCCPDEGEDCPEEDYNCDESEKFLHKGHEQCCDEEGEDCPEEAIQCHDTEMFLRKSYTTCCEADGEDCPHDHVSSCEHVEHVLSRVLFESRLHSYEKCCPDEGEDCPEEAIQCHDTEM